MSVFSADQSQAQQPSVPVVVKTLLSINIAVFLLGWLNADLGARMLEWFALWPLNSPGYLRSGGYIFATPEFYPWQVISYSFLHGGWAHIFFNMYALFLFGSVLEKIWGWKRFCLYYFVCVLGAAIAQLIVTYGKAVPTVGASGGVFGLLLAYGVFFPRVRLQLMFPPIALEARWFVLIYGLLELTLGVSGTQSGVAHFAHLGGMAIGFPLVWYWLRQYRKNLQNTGFY